MIDKFRIELDTDEYAWVTVVAYEPYQSGSSNSIPEECYPPEPASVDWFLTDANGVRLEVSGSTLDWIESLVIEKMEREQ